MHGSKRFTRGLQRAFPYIHVAAPETEASDGTLLRFLIKKAEGFPSAFAMRTDEPRVSAFHAALGCLKRVDLLSVSYTHLRAHET